MTFPWLFHDYSMTIPWLFHDYSMTIPWQFHDNSMTIPWQFHDNSMTIPWLFHDDFTIYMSINFISISNLQTTSKTWAKTRGNAAQFWILTFFVLDVKFRRPEIQNDKKQTLSIWFQIQKYKLYFRHQNHKQKHWEMLLFLNFAILAS
jgi:hypothetical protein